MLKRHLELAFVDFSFFFLFILEFFFAEEFVGDKDIQELIHDGGKLGRKRNFKVFDRKIGCF